VFRLQIDDDLISNIHSDTLQILSKIGIALSHDEALDMLQEAGATSKNGRVYLDEKLLYDALGRCPTCVEIHGREPKRKIRLGDGRLYCHNLGGAAKVYDHHSKETRPAEIRDIVESTLLLDALGSVSSITPLFTPTDIEQELMSVAMVRYTLPFTTKPVHGPGVATGAEVAFIHELASVLGDPSEMLTIAVSPQSALRFPDHTVDAILKTAALNVPFGPLPCPIAGATSPMSLSGSIAQQNAEVLASIIIGQLRQPGLPVFYCGRISAIDPRSMKSRWSGPEVGKMSAVTVVLGHSYHLPVNVYGITSTSIIDEQRTFERMSNALLPALAMADEISGIGELECGQTSCIGQIVYDIDIVDYIQHIRRGILYDEEALSVIHEVIDGGGFFADQFHTVKHLRSRESPAISYKPHEEAQLREGSLDWARSRAQGIIREHEVLPLDQHEIRALDKVMEKARDELVE